MAKMKNVKKLNANLVDLLLINEQQKEQKRFGRQLQSKLKSCSKHKVRMRDIGIKKCPKCHVDLKKIKPTKHGFRYARGAKIQRYCCKRCNYRFEKCGMTYRMRNPRWKILKAIELRDKGKSYACIANELGGMSRQTILKWLRNRRRKKNKLIEFTRVIPAFKRFMNNKIINQSEHKRTFKIEI